MLDLCDFIDVFQRDLPNGLLAWVAGALQLAFLFFDAGCVQEHPRCRGRAQLEGEGAVRADDDPGGDGGALGWG
jgi:hypothetical protein